MKLPRNSFRATLGASISPPEKGCLARVGGPPISVHTSQLSPISLFTQTSTWRSSLGFAQYSSLSRKVMKDPLTLLTPRDLASETPKPLRSKYSIRESDFHSAC